ncbi:MAG TPA: hypothetical protein VFV40_00640 [Nocardioides sp.]|nr:hypothetical protein [Nocardioides sp.]
MTVVAGLVGAVWVGGVSQTLVWRWGPGLDRLADVTGSQFMWVLLTFGVAWGWAAGRLVPGAVAAALTGLALIAGYYVTQWVVDGRHAAVAQFAGTGGVAWTLAAVGGGAVMGVFGALAGLDGQVRPRLKALGLATPALIVGGGPLLWIWVHGRHLEVSGLLPAVAVFMIIGAALLVVAVRTSGRVPCLQAVALSTALGTVALGGLLALQTSGWLYLTF